MNIYVGNLAYEVNDSDLKNAFGSFGKVVSARVINDNFTGKSKGFGFVEMDSRESGEAAINGLNGKELKGRPLRVNEARPREERPPRRGFGGGGGGGGGGGPRRRDY